MPHCVDASVKTMQAPALRALVNGLPRYFRLFKLPQRHYSVLPGRDFRYRCIGRVAFVAHMSTKAPRKEILPQEVALRS